VNGLGEFSPFGWLFLGSFLKLLRSRTYFWATFFHDESYISILTNNVLGYILGHLFTNSSGHPESDAGRVFRTGVTYL
jgi:hypothetical protein